MKQGKGTDVLGANDPRSDAIGVIYVSPNDDRKSVLAAILTQEKLGRKQVAVVLPADQNKAFQRPGDFDDLKTMRRKMQTQVVFIAPSGPGPAEFARQRRFLVYSSLENYAKALRDDTQVENASKKGWLFGSGSPRTKADNIPVAPRDSGTMRRFPTGPLIPAAQDLNTPSYGRSTPYEDDDEQQHNDALPLIAGAGAGAALGFGGAALAAHASDGPATPISDDPLSDPARASHDFADDADALGPVTSTHTPTARDITGPTQAISPARSADASTDGGSIIELRPRRSSKATLPLTPREPAPVPVTPAVEPETDSYIQRPKRPSSKIPAAAAGAVAGAAIASAAVSTPARAAVSPGRASTASAAVTPRAGGPGGIPPRGTPPGGGGRGNQRGPARPARLIIIGVIILVLLLLLGTAVMAYAQPKSPIGQFAHGLVSKPQSPATITITPNSQQVQDNYTLTGAATTNAATREIAVRTIIGASQSAATLVQATGHNQHPAVAATGQITFYNALTFEQQVNAGTTFNLGGGLQIITDTAAAIPAGNGVTNGVQTVDAHASPVGAVGNIGALAINNLACCGNGIIARNLNAFTGGQDATNYTFLKKSDVNNAISQSIMNATKQGAISDLNKQIRTGEQLLNAPSCTSKLQADQPIGDHGTNVTRTNVTYGLKCTVTAYDNLGAQNIVKDLLTQKAAVTPGPGYVLVNNIQASLISQATTKNTHSFFFSGKGVWAYLFSDAQKLSLEKAIAGKTVADAQTILKNTPGISNATINVNGGNTLPTDYNQISIVIQPIAGLGGGTPPPTNGSPTVTNPTVQSGTPGSNGKGGSAPPTGGSS
jgi:hypothetical protein